MSILSMTSPFDTSFPYICYLRFHGFISKKVARVLADLTSHLYSDASYDAGETRRISGNAADAFTRDTADSSAPTRYFRNFIYDVIYLSRRFMLAKRVR